MAQKTEFSAQNNEFMAQNNEFMAQNNEFKDFEFIITDEMFNNTIDTLVIKQMLKRPLLSKKDKKLLEQESIRLRNEFVRIFKESNEEKIKEFEILITDRK